MMAIANNMATTSGGFKTAYNPILTMDVQYHFKNNTATSGGTLLITNTTLTFMGTSSNIPGMPILF
jgi:hypothetical protein